MLTLEPPSVNKGQFPLKMPRPAGQSISKMAEMRFFVFFFVFFFYKNRFIGQFSLT
jgi:hypothetical protein